LAAVKSTVPVGVVGVPVPVSATLAVQVDRRDDCSVAGTQATVVVVGLAPAAVTVTEAEPLLVA